MCNLALEGKVKRDAFVLDICILDTRLLSQNDASLILKVFVGLHMFESGNLYKSQIGK